jgi:hypothetical protein
MNAWMVKDCSFRRHFAVCISPLGTRFLRKDQNVHQKTSY